jgi:hypothetical protein
MTPTTRCPRSGAIRALSLRTSMPSSWRQVSRSRAARERHRRGWRPGRRRPAGPAGRRWTRPPPRATPARCRERRCGSTPAPWRKTAARRGCLVPGPPALAAVEVRDQQQPPAGRRGQVPDQRADLGFQPLCRHLAQPRQRGIGRPGRRGGLGRGQASSYVNHAYDCSGGHRQNRASHRGEGVRRICRWQDQLGWAARSGDGRLVVGMMPDLLPPAAGCLAGQDGDAGRAGDAPAHSGRFQLLADDGLCSLLRRPLSRRACRGRGKRAWRIRWALVSTWASALSCSLAFRPAGGRAGAGGWLGCRRCRVLRGVRPAGLGGRRRA